MRATLRECETCGYKSIVLHQQELKHKPKFCGGLMKIIAEENHSYQL